MNLQDAVGRRVVITAGLVYGASGKLVLDRVENGRAVLELKGCAVERIPVNRITNLVVFPPHLTGVQGAP
jgi:hypothetical protein